MAEAGKNISDTIIIGPDCREQFLPLDDSDYAALTDGGLQLGGISQLAGNYRVARSGSGSAVLICTSSGSGRWSCDGDSAVMTAGSAWLFGAGASYSYQINSDNWEIFWLHLDGRREWATGQQPVQLLGPAHAQLSDVMSALIDEQHSNLPARGQAIASYTQLLWIWLDRTLGREKPAGDVMAERLGVLWRDVSAHLQHKWSVHSLAKRMHVSAAHLHKLTQRYEGRTPMQCVGQLRMQRAKSLLDAGGFSLDDIAAAVGYQGPFAFSRAFKKHTGLSPRDFRSRSRS